MKRRNRFIPTVVAAALLALCLPALAAAQGTYDPYGRPDYRRDRDRARDDVYGSSGRYSRREVKDSINRLNDLAHDFQKRLDDVLDHSREDGTRHEDHLNADVKDFHHSIHDLKDRFDDERNLNRSANEARRVLDIGAHVEGVVRHHFNDYRLRQDWSQIRRELDFIAGVYGYDMYGYNGDSNYGRSDDRYGRNQDYRRNRDEDVYRNDRNNRRNNNDQWWRRLPRPN